MDLLICDIVLSIKLFVAHVGELMGSKISQAKFNSWESKGPELTTLCNTETQKGLLYIIMYHVVY